MHGLNTPEQTTKYVIWKNALLGVADFGFHHASIVHGKTSTLFGHFITFSNDPMKINTRYNTGRASPLAVFTHIHHAFADSGIDVGGRCAALDCV